MNSYLIEFVRRNGIAGHRIIHADSIDLALNTIACQFNYVSVRSFKSCLAVRIK